MALTRGLPLAQGLASTALCGWPRLHCALPGAAVRPVRVEFAVGFLAVGGEDMLMRQTLSCTLEVQVQNLE